MNESNNPNVVAVPDPNNLFIWNYCIYNLKDCDYEGGYYHGQIMFPQEYPKKPPGIQMITPNGRFHPKMRICLTISDYHPETWNPVWKVETIIVGLMSFMTSEENAAGAMYNVSKADRKKHAMESLKWNMDNDKTEKFI